MSNGTISPAENLPGWAIAHDASSTERAHAQDGVNSRIEMKVKEHGGRIGKLEKQGAAAKSYAMVAGTLICIVISSVIPALIAAWRGN